MRYCFASALAECTVCQHKRHLLSKIVVHQRCASCSAFRRFTTCTSSEAVQSVKHPRCFPTPSSNNVVGRLMREGVRVGRKQAYCVLNSSSLQQIFQSSGHSPRALKQRVQLVIHAHTTQDRSIHISLTTTTTHFPQTLLHPPPNSYPLPSSPLPHYPSSSFTPT